jgi:hypothetical protein
MVSRDEIAHLCAEHDRLMREHDQWMARREAAGAAPVQKSDEPGINSLQPAPEPDAEPPLGRAEAVEAIGGMIVALRREWRTEREVGLAKRDRRIGELEGEIRELKGLVNGLLTLVGQKQPKLWTP